MTSLAVQLSGVRVEFDAHVALHNIDLGIEEGSYLVILGPSGSGKTTLLNVLGGFLMPAAGQVQIRGEDFTFVPPAKRPTATVFQDYALFPHMSVAGNVAFGLKMRNVPRAAQRERVTEVLDLVGLGQSASKRVHELSGGQRQRVALARSLVVEPSVLLLDEPLGALDLKLRRQMQDELKAIQERVGTTFVHVTHDQVEAMAIADTIVVMNEGRIVDQGAPERVYLRPATRFAAEFMGESNLLEGRISSAPEGSYTVQTAFGSFQFDGQLGAVDTGVVISIRPEHLHLEQADGRLPLAEGEVVETGFYGTHHQCLAAVKGVEIPFRVRLPQKTSPSRGEPINLFADPEDMVVLAE